ncbi:MAG: VCBS repeat-containing protein [Flavobacteriales bacterium]|nr:VCBS repeat-containing protein [Flavobacteriales bacterium]
MSRPILHKIAFIIILAFLTIAVRGQGYVEVSGAIGVDHLHISPMLMGGGAAFIDFNMDGYEDLYLTGGVAADKLFRNNGDGTFTDVTSSAGITGTDTVNTMGVIAGDLDNDGFKELFVTTWDGYHNLLFQNNGNGTFQEISIAASINDTALSVSATFGDINKDGLLDVYVGNYINLSIVAPNGFDYTCYANYLYINNGNFNFTESGLAYGVADTGCALAVAFTDYDDEQDIDVYLANDFGKWVLPNSLYANDFPTPLYTDVTLSAGVNDSIFGMGVAIGDYDEDGDFDYYITNLGRNVLRQNQGNGTFMDYTDSAGVPNTYTDSVFFAVGWGTAFYDYDNDTYLDLIVSNGYIPADSFIYNTPSNPNVLFRNTGGGLFQDVSDIKGFNDTTIGRGLAIGDYNYDGAVDVVVGVVHNDTSSVFGSLVYRNEEQGNNWLKVSLQGVTTSRDAFGSHLAIYAGGRVFVREVDGGSSHLSHSSSIVHFGLGNIPVVDSVIINWLNGGTDTVLNIDANQTLYVIEDSLFYTIHYQNLQICNGDSIFVGGSFQFNPGIYHDTLVSGPGYDSIVHSSVTYTSLILDSMLIEICAGDSLYAGGGFQYTSGFYIDSLTGVVCDSTLVTELTVLSAIVNGIGASICEGGLYQGVPYNNDTVLMNIQTAANGCDSVVTITLTVMPASTNVVDTTVCEGVFYLGTPYFANTTLLDTFSNSVGCDSVVTTNIQVTFTDSTTSTISICEGDSINGAEITSDTILVDLFISPDSCKHISILEVSVEAMTVSNTNLTVDWGDTVNGFILYADTVLVETFVAINGCDSIEQLTISVGAPIAIDEIQSKYQNKVSCYPNPFTSEINLEISLSKLDNVQIIIEDLLGRPVAIIFEGTLGEGLHLFAWNGVSLSGYPVSSGLYICRVRLSDYINSSPIMLLE